MSERKRCATCKHKSLRLTQKPCNCCGPFHGNWEPAFEPIIETPVMTKNEPPTITYDKNISMIKSIIDEAMEKRDRSVSIFIRGDTMSVSVTPLGEDEPRWIPKDVGSEEKVEEKTKGVDFSKSCSKCKHRWDAVRNTMKEIETGEDMDDDNICEHCYNYDEFEPEIPKED